MAKHGGRQISDPIHGVIQLTPLEVAIIGARAFQRLRSVKQLGLAHYVFPGADYSRFSHSVGACHVMGRILGALRPFAPEFLTDEQVRLYRAAALLHDVGHYPFSHATEYALKNYYSSQQFDTVAGADGPVQFVMHESVTALVISEDPEISKALRDAGINPKDVENIIRRQVPTENLSNLISSDLDADRIDYLLRTAHHAGLPYGNVDIDYLLTQMRLDKRKQVCLTARAIRAADHMLLCRYFDYQQVTFHKGVQGFEWVLKECVSDIVSASALDGSKENVEKMIRSGDWADFDDAALVAQIRKRRLDGSSDEKLRAACVLDRKPPVVLAHDEDVVSHKELTRKDLRKVYKQAMIECGKKFSIPEQRMNLWAPSPLRLTKSEGHIDVSELTSTPEKRMDDVGQAVLILDEQTGLSRPIQNERRSLMSVLSDYGVGPLRIYALLSNEEERHVEEMKTFVKKATA